MDRFANYKKSKELAQVSNTLPSLRMGSLHHPITTPSPHHPIIPSPHHRNTTTTTTTTTLDAFVPQIVDSNDKAAIKAAVKDIKTAPLLAKSVDVATVEAPWPGPAADYLVQVGLELNLSIWI